VVVHAGRSARGQVDGLGVVCCDCGAHGFRLLVSADQAKTVVREKEYRARVFGVRSIDSIAGDYVERAAALDPALATFAGIAGHDHELPDLSADGFAERAGLDRATLAALAALDAAEAPGLREQTARAAMQERLALAVERYDAGDTTSELNVIASWVHDVRQVFDLMPAEGEEAAATAQTPAAASPPGRHLPEGSGRDAGRACLYRTHHPAGLTGD
jgi:hypothetical protein